jgi:hypothetical protein
MTPTNDLIGQCFVMQPFDHGRYDSLYEQVFEPAIRDAKLTPYRVDNDPAASIPIETVEEEISRSVACFAEISENNPNVWFELGYALAREKPLCMVCSDTRSKFPFDVQHRKIIKYPSQPLPKDYEGLKQAITSRLIAVVEKEESSRQNAETVSALSVVPETGGLAPHELLALTLIFQDHFDTGTPPYELSDSMKKGGYIKAATNLAAAGLIKKKLVELRSVELQNYSEDRFFVTERGVDWLMSNQQKLNLKLVPAVAPDYADQGITDDDIPF